MFISRNNIHNLYFTSITLPTMNASKSKTRNSLSQEKKYTKESKI